MKLIFWFSKPSIIILSDPIIIKLCLIQSKHWADDDDDDDDDDVIKMLVIFFIYLF